MPSEPATKPLPALNETQIPEPWNEIPPELWPCGTFAPGDINDPCQHSTSMQLCCVCAGCSRDRWWCGALVAVSTVWTDVKPQLTSKSMTITYGLMIIWSLVSDLLAEAAQWILLIVMAGGLAAVSWALTSLT